MPQGNGIALLHHLDGIEGAILFKLFHEAGALKDDVMLPLPLSDFDRPPFFWLGLNPTHNSTDFWGNGN